MQAPPPASSPYTLSDDELISLQAWRADAVSRMPYLAPILFAMRVVKSPKLGTFAVDKDFRVYIDFDQANTWGPGMSAEVLLHETSHLFQEHHESARVAGVDARQFKLWGAAADMAINDDLRDAGCAELASFGLLPEQIGEPDYQTPHHYFQALLNRAPHQPTGSAGDPYSGCGSGSGGEPAPCELPPGEGDASVAGLTDEEKQQALLSTAARIVEHQKSRGNVPGGLTEQARALLAPSPTPWQQVLGALIRRGVTQTTTGSFDVSYSRRNRRRANIWMQTSNGPRKAIFPGMVSPRPSIEIVRDTSGSMSPRDLAVVGREIAAIAARLGIRGEDLMVTDVDAGAHEPVPYRNAKSIETAHGRGGTDMRVGIAAACARRRTPSAIVVLTDGDTPWPTERPSVPVVACLVVEGGAGAEQQVQRQVPDFIKSLVVRAGA